MFEPQSYHDIAPGPERLVDLFGRTVSYLRLSLTDQCNLRCLYCTPRGQEVKLDSVELLSFEELIRVVSVAVNMGVKKLRLTGGEPLVRRGIMSCIKGLAGIPSLDDIRLTTNGILLGDFAEELYEAGIRKLNISMDTLQPRRYQMITGHNLFDRLWAAIQKVEKMGFAPIKLNVVVLRGMNDDELLDFGRLSLRRPFHIRFIEFMPIGKSTIWEKEKYFSTAEIKARLAPLGPLKDVDTGRGGIPVGPAEVYRLPGAVGTLGFISPISHQFCDHCNRLRLTSEGKLRSCLFSDEEIDLKGVLRSGASDNDIKKLFAEAILNKPKGHTLQRINDGDQVNCHGWMSRIGG